jgi:hypothetical protein
VGRRFSGAGLGRRPGRSSGRAAGAAAPPPTFAQILAGYIIHEYDAELGAVVTGAGVSLHDDAIGTRDLLQTVDANRCAYTAAGALSYYTGDGLTKHLVTAVGASLTNGDFCFISVAKLNATTTGRVLFGVGDATTSRSRIRTHSAGTSFGAIVQDAGGADSIIGGASDLNVHCHILRNEVGVSRKLHLDGGAGVAGARTTAPNGANTMIASLGTTTGVNVCNARSYYEAICIPAPPLAVLNTFGAAAAARFGFTWSAMT